MRLVYLVMFILAGWMISRTGMDSFSMKLSDKQFTGLESVGLMANAAMLIVAYFAAPLLNFGDFARFAKDETAMKRGNFWGLPVNFIVFAIITVIVTGGSLHYDGGWNRKALFALAISGSLAIGLSLLGAFGLMFNVGDWGWLIGSAAGAALYVAVNRISAPVSPVAAGA